MPRKKTIVENLPINTIQNLIPIPMGKLVEDSIIRYGSYINTCRHIPSLIDGMKPSYRRLYYTSTKFKKGELIPNNTLIGKVSDIHPHGVDGLIGTIATFVRSGVFTGAGAYGGAKIDGSGQKVKADPPAAPRYTKSRISDKYLELIGDLINEVPMTESPNGPMEIVALPTPIPFALGLMKERLLGLGLGIATTIPNFSPISLYSAMMADNPQLLEPNTFIGMDKKHSELQKLWDTGEGYITYYYNIKKTTTSDGREGILIEGDPEVFQINLKKVRQWEADNKVTIDDLTDINGPKMVISRIPNARGITIDDIEAECKRICISRIKFQVYVSFEGSAFQIPIKEWLKYTYNNYINLRNQVNAKRINQVQFEIKVQESLPIIVEYILNKNPKASNSEICNALGLSDEIVSSVLTKPINYLRKTKDNADKIKSLKAKLKELKSFDAVKYTYEIIQKL